MKSKEKNKKEKRKRKRSLSLVIACCTVIALCSRYFLLSHIIHPSRTQYRLIFMQRTVKKVTTVRVASDQNKNKIQKKKLSIRYTNIMKPLKLSTMIINYKCVNTSNRTMLQNRFVSTTAVRDDVFTFTRPKRNPIKKIKNREK